MTEPYEVLARRYRPRTFSEVVGQEAVTGCLRGALRTGQVGHAYLFAGPRGVGKTTTARILARALNCARGPAEEPCGTCDPCREIERGADPDVLEIDAASHRGIEEARELRATVAVRPMRSRFRVYILDEVHQLTREAFNALLKTLEEPPPHAKFVFATTELHKVPETIRSRCQTFEFRPIGQEAISRRLRQIAQREGFGLDAAALDEIAIAARGGLRDAETLLDQLVAFAGPSAGREDLARLLGRLGPDEVVALFDRTASGDRRGVLETLDRLFAAGASEEAILAAALDHARALLRVAACGEEAPAARADLSAETYAAVVRQAAAFSPDRLEEAMQVLLSARGRLLDAEPARRASVELAFLRLARGPEFLAVPQILERLEALERGLSAASIAAPRGRTPAPAAATSRRVSPAPPGSEGPSGPPPRSATDLWKAALAKLRVKHSVVADELSGVRVVSLDGDVLRLHASTEGMRGALLGNDTPGRRALEAALAEVAGRALAFTFEEGGVVSPRRRGGADGLDPALGRVLETFEGEVVEER